MKKAIALVLALCLALGLSASALAYADQNLQAPKAQNVVIDGDLSEWDTSKCLRIDSQSQIIDQIEHWDGAADCSMEAYAMWDEENLYLAMKIWDDTPLVYREGFPLDELDAEKARLVTDDCSLFELTGRPEKINAFLKMFSGYDILELCRTGITALERGGKHQHMQKPAQEVRDAQLPLPGTHCPERT